MRTPGKAEQGECMVYPRVRWGREGEDKGKEGIAGVNNVMYHEEQQDLIFEGLGCDPG